jgi:hypothetical protein
MKLLLRVFSLSLPVSLLVASLANHTGVTQSIKMNLIEEQQAPLVAVQQEIANVSNSTIQLQQLEAIESAIKSDIQANSIDQHPLMLLATASAYVELTPEIVTGALKSMMFGSTDGFDLLAPVLLIFNILINAVLIAFILIFISTLEMNLKLGNFRKA